jgi:hypothetical protein
MLDCIDTKDMRVLSSICSGARLGPLRAPAAERGVVHDPLVKDALRHTRVAAAQRLGFGRIASLQKRGTKMAAHYV